MADNKTYYLLLGINEKAIQEEIKIAYRKKAKELHPDKNKDIDTTQKFQEINEAYEILNNPENRKYYDSDIPDDVVFKMFNEEITPSDFIKYSTNTETLKCNCEDWIKNRNKYPRYDHRRLCKHLVAKFTVTKYDDDYIEELDIPEALKPFEKYIISRRYNFEGVKLFSEIVFLKSSIIVMDYNETHIYLHLKKSSNLCSYKIFEAHKYKGIGYKWMHKDDREVIYEDNIDGKDYINKRFNVINADVPLCNHLYWRLRDQEEMYASKEYKEHCIQKEYRAKYNTFVELLKITERYTTRNFNLKLQEMGYLLKTKELNNNNWIVLGDGLDYGINYIGEASVANKEVPSWYISSSFNKDTMSFQNQCQTKSIIKTNVMWEKKKFDTLLKVMDEYIIIPRKYTSKEKQKSSRQIIREEWLKDVSCHSCNSKNIHKKDIRQRKNYKVQRYQCMDCKSIFQEELCESSSEIENLDIKGNNEKT